MSTPQTTEESDAVQQAYLAEASGDLVAMSFPGARKVAGWLFWVVFPLFAIVSLVFVVLAFVSHVGHQPDGIKGTFVANRLCSRGICVVGGVFTSEDGTIKNESLLGDSRWKTDEMHQVVWNPHGVEVSALGTWDATVTVLGGVAAVSYLAAVGWFAQGMRRGRRH